MGKELGWWAPFGRPGGDLLSRALRRSTIGAEGFHGRVRNGIGCLAPRHDHQVIEAERGRDPVRRSPRLMSLRTSAFGCPSLRLPRFAAGEDWPRFKPNERLVPVSWNALRRLHTRPINVVVCHGSSGRPGLEEGFPLRCLQRLSRPHIATRRCGWRHNRYTRGASIPVLSY